MCPGSLEDCRTPNNDDEPIAFAKTCMVCSSSNQSLEFPVVQLLHYNNIAEQTELWVVVNNMGTKPDSCTLCSCMLCQVTVRVMGIYKFMNSKVLFKDVRNRPASNQPPMPVMVHISKYSSGPGLAGTVC